MTEKTETPRWVTNVIHTCMGLQRGEKILIVVDEPLGHARNALLAEAAQTDPAELWSYTFPNASRPLSEYPSPLLALVTQVDAIVFLFASVNQLKESPALLAGRAAIGKGMARTGLGAFIDQSILDIEMSADYGQIAKFTDSLTQRLQGSSIARITTALGTNLRLSLASREWKKDTGILRGQKAFGNLPAGETYIAPVEDSAEGVLVVDKCFPGMLLSEPTRMTFEKGRVMHVEGGAGAEFLRSAFAQHGDSARVVAELGIGTNPLARLQGNIITDEKVLGTIHVAVGRSDFFGGKNVATTHIDGVVGHPTLEIDGKVLIENGEHL